MNDRNQKSPCAVMDKAISHYRFSSRTTAKRRRSKTTCYAGEVDAYSKDHVHVFVSIPPKYSVA